LFLSLAVTEESVGGCEDTGRAAQFVAHVPSVLSGPRLETDSVMSSTTSAGRRDFRVEVPFLKNTHLVSN
jgi:hypothetical protein